MPAADAFIARWNGTERAERANYIPFLAELCALLDVEPPPPARGGLGDYRYERAVSRPEPDGSVSNRRIDLYKRCCFVLEAKQGANEAPNSLFGLKDTERRAGIRRSAGWAQAMLKAKGQAEAYAKDVPPEEGWPPFLIVCDVGFCFDLYADFSGTGKHYAQFPDRERFRLYLTDLHDAAIRARLRAIWLDPQSLDPARHRLAVTRDIGAVLAKLVSGLEAGNPPDQVASFLMRAIFCMFAQSVGLLPTRTVFTDLLRRCQADPIKFVPLVGEFWRAMNLGGFSVAAEAELRRFNGGLYAGGAHGPVEPLRLDADGIGLLIAASLRDWADVEPAIFGTLLENALNTRLRGQLGAHFTPRQFVERLVLPTVMEPLRAEWDGTTAAAFARAQAGDRAGAAALIADFHARLCAVRVLDPACGSGNFLYVTMELMKRLEGEVLDLLAVFATGEGDRLALAHASVDPHQFFGLEKNPRAVPVAELVLWIGYLQWHFRTRGDAPPAEPILRDFRNIIHADALLDYEREEMERDAAGQPVTRWDGETVKRHPVTGEDVPDETARVVVMRPVKPRVTVWPAADFIVGNPPFIGGKYLRAELGDGYVEALWNSYPKVPKTADLAMFFWWKAAQMVVAPKGGAKRFGLITSNSISQVFGRRVIADALAARRKLRLLFAIPDHPWSTGKSSAAVRIAMTVATSAASKEVASPILQTVIEQHDATDDVPKVSFSTIEGNINSDLTVGADASVAEALLANTRISSPGVKLHGSGFIVSPPEARRLGLGTLAKLDQHIRSYLNGRDLTQRSRGDLVIDCYGLNEGEIRRRYPALYEHLLLRVKPERQENSRATYRDNWWIFGEPRAEIRKALFDLTRYVATPVTAKHRLFCFLPSRVVADDALVIIASDSAFVLGALSSSIHSVWAAASGGTLEDRRRYLKTRCFDPFPFPLAGPAQRKTIAAIAEELDALRRTCLDANPQLTMTGLYNVLEKLRAGAALTTAERDIHDAGHVSILRDLHDRLDREVAAAYGWRPDLTPSEIVARIVALNAERRAQEARGTIHWLRPEFQAPREAPRATQAAMDVTEAEDTKLPAWPAGAPAQFVALRAALSGAPGTPIDLARRFRRAPSPKVREMLETLTALGQAHRAQDGSYYL